MVPGELDGVNKQLSEKNQMLAEEAEETVTVVEGFSCQECKMYGKTHSVVLRDYLTWVRELYVAWVLGECETQLNFEIEENTGVGLDIKRIEGVYK